VPTLILPDAVTIIKNTGKLESKGAELEINALLLKGLELNYNFGYTDAVYNSLKVSQNSTEVNLQGKRQIFTPDITSMLALQYGVGIGAKKTNKFFVRGEWKYLGKQYFDLANTIVQSPYSIFNGQLGLTIKNISIIFWGRNLNDKNYIQYGYDFGAVHLGNPKTLGTTISIKI
jgi:TonB dependent receptor.